MLAIRIPYPGELPTATDMSRVAVDDDHIIGHMTVARHTLRYGRARLRIAAVSYDGDHAGELMRDLLPTMIEQGAHLALVYDRHDVFGDFGFSAVWPEYRFEFDAAAAAALSPLLPLRSPFMQEIPRMAAVYDRHWSARVSLVRTAETWMQRAGDPVRVLPGADSTLDGYIVNRGNGRVEAVVDTAQAAQTVLAEAGRQQRSGTIRWMVPPDDALVFFARRWLDVTVSAHYPLRGGWMGRLIDAAALITELLPEISAQAGIDPSLLTIRCRPNTVSIGFGGHDIRLDYRDFMQVMFGAVSPAMVADSAGASLLQALFPPRIAALGCWDWF